MLEAPARASRQRPTDKDPLIHLNEGHLAPCQKSRRMPPPQLWAFPWNAATSCPSQRLGKKCNSAHARRVQAHLGPLSDDLPHLLGGGKRRTPNPQNSPECDPLNICVHKMLKQVHLKNQAQRFNKSGKLAEPRPLLQSCNDLYP